MAADWYSASGEPHFRFEKRDICEPFDPGPVEYVFNFASPASPPEYLHLPIETLRVGSIGVENMLQIAARYGAGILHASTSECYGDPIEHPQAESYWDNVNPIGPLHPDDGRVIVNFITQVLRGEPLTIYGDGSQTRSFYYIDDLIEEIMRLACTNEHLTILTSATPMSAGFWSARRRCSRSRDPRASYVLSRCPWTIQPAAGPTSPGLAPSWTGSRE